LLKLESNVLKINTRFVPIRDEHILRPTARLLAHELAHHRYEKIEDTDEGASYRKASGWKLTPEGDKFFWTGRKQGYVEEDGGSAPKEDFANNIDHFLFDPIKLKQVTPGAYEWIKKRFSGKFKISGSVRD
jgi:hypothetical protein